MVQLSCIHAEGQYGPFDLRFHNGYKTMTEVQYNEMVKRDPEMWQRFLDREEIVVLREGQTPVTAGPKITIHRAEEPEQPKPRPSGIPVFTPKSEPGVTPEGTDTETVVTEDVSKAPIIPTVVDTGKILTPQAPVAGTEAPAVRAPRGTRKRT